MILPGVIASSGGVASSYESIATSNPSASSTFDFTSISSTYKHLQIRYSVSGSVNGTGIRIRFNSDTASNYYCHYLYGDGATAGAGSQGITSSGIIGGVTTTSNVTYVGVVDILDYTSTNKNKTVRTLYGFDANGSGEVYLMSVLWSATPAAITSITIYPSSGTITGKFALYGVKG